MKCFRFDYILVLSLTGRFVNFFHTLYLLPNKEKWKNSVTRKKGEQIYSAFHGLYLMRLHCYQMRFLSIQRRLFDSIKKESSNLPLCNLATLKLQLARITKDIENIVQSIYWGDHLGLVGSMKLSFPCEIRLFDTIKEYSSILQSYNWETLTF